MSLLWTPIWKKLFATRAIPLALKQNYRLLEIVGEPVYLLMRIRKSDKFDIEPKVKIFNKTNLIQEGNFCYLVLWKKGVNLDQDYPDVRDIIIEKGSNSNFILMQNVSLPEFLTDVDFYFTKVIRNNAELNIEHEVRIYFHQNLLNTNDEFHIKFFTIHPDFSEVYNQSMTYSSSALSLYGWRLAQWRGCYYRDKFIHNAFLVAMPDLLRDLNLSSSGFMVSSEYSLWASPPPFAPLLREHDIIVRLNGLRYEIRDMTYNMLQNMLLQQEFKIGEIEPSHPVYNIPVDTVAKTLKGFPNKIYTGA